MTTGNAPTIELQPCPFCGSPAHTEANPDFGAGPDWLIHAGCGPDCGAQPCILGDTEADVIEKWNRRARIDGALAEPVEPIGYIDADQLRRWNVLKGTEYESPERCYMPFSRKPWKSEMSDCSLAVYAAPASQWRRVEDWCKWSPEDAVEMPDTWRGDCGILWTFTEGGPHENGVKFCHNCGKQVALPLPALPESDKCEHGKGLTDYCQPCGRING